METFSPTCAGCGAPIDIPAGASQATCEHCGAQLRIKMPERDRRDAEAVPEVTLLETTKSGLEAAQAGIEVVGKGMHVLDTGMRFLNTLKLLAIVAVVAMVLFLLAMIALCSAPLWWQSSPPETSGAKQGVSPECHAQLGQPCRPEYGETLRVE